MKHLPSLAAYNDFIMSTGTARGFEKDQIRTAMNMEKRWKEDTGTGYHTTPIFDLFNSEATTNNDRNISTGI